METKCHLGESIVYDTVSNLSWSVDIRNHGIVTVIENVLGKPWTACDGVGREVPIPKREVDCVECYSWEFGDFPPAVAGEVSQRGGAKVYTPRSDQ